MVIGNPIVLNENLHRTNNKRHNPCYICSYPSLWQNFKKPYNFHTLQKAKLSFEVWCTAWAHKVFSYRCLRNFFESAKDLLMVFWNPGQTWFIEDLELWHTIYQLRLGLRKLSKNSFCIHIVIYILHHLSSVINIRRHPFTIIGQWWRKAKLRVPVSQTSGSRKKKRRWITFALADAADTNKKWPRTHTWTAPPATSNEFCM